jgi:hypothetical protein
MASLLVEMGLANSLPQDTFNHILRISASLAGEVTGVSTWQCFFFFLNFLKQKYS